MDRKRRLEKKYKVVDEFGNLIGKHFTEAMAIIQSKEMQQLYNSPYFVKRRGKNE